MILALLIANVLFSSPVVVPVYQLIEQTGGTLAARRMFADKIDAIWLIDLFNLQLPGVALESMGIQLIVLLIVMGLSYLLVSTLLAGGIIEVLSSDDGLFTMRKFWSGCGAYFWRFFRLMLLSLFCYGAALIVYFVIERSIETFAGQATAYEPVALRKWANMSLLVLLLAFVNMVFDYAKIRTVIRDSRQMLDEAAGAFKFVLRHFLSASGLYLLLSIVAIALFILPAWLRSSINQSSAMAVLLAIFLGEAAVAARVWSRLTFYGAELDLYQRLGPRPAIVIAAPPPTGVEFLAATTELDERSADEQEGQTESAPNEDSLAANLPADAEPSTATKSISQIEGGGSKDL